MIALGAKNQVLVRKKSNHRRQQPGHKQNELITADRKSQSEQNKNQITNRHIDDSRNHEPHFFVNQKPSAGNISFFFQHSSLFLINISTRHSFLKHRQVAVKDQRTHPGRLCPATGSLFATIRRSTLRPPVSTLNFSPTATIKNTSAP